MSWKAIEQLERTVKLKDINPPYTPKTFSQWRDSMWNSNMNMVEFSTQVDSIIFKRFLEQIYTTYTNSCKWNIPALGIDPQIVQDMMDNELYSIKEEYISLIARQQTQIEYAYDLMRRTQTYKLVDLNQCDTDWMPLDDGNAQVETIAFQILENCNKMISTYLQSQETIGVDFKPLIDLGCKVATRVFYNDLAGALQEIAKFNFGKLFMSFVKEYILSKLQDRAIQFTINQAFNTVKTYLHAYVENLTTMNNGLDTLIRRCIIGYEERKSNIQQYGRFNNIYLEILQIIH